MPKVIVNIFTGINPQVPKTYEIEAKTYQDIVTAIIRSGMESGKIYRLDGERINYGDPITSSQVNYIISDNINKLKMNIRSLELGKNLFIDVDKNGTFRDIYNFIIAHYDIPKNISFVVRGKLVDLDADVLPYDPNGLNAIHMVVIREINPPRQRPYLRKRRRIVV